MYWTTKENCNHIHTSQFLFTVKHAHWGTYFPESTSIFNGTNCISTAINRIKRARNTEISTLAYSGFTPLTWGRGPAHRIRTARPDTAGPRLGSPGRILPAHSLIIIIIQNKQIIPQKGSIQDTTTDDQCFPSTVDIYRIPSHDYRIPTTVPGGSWRCWSGSRRSWAWPANSLLYFSMSMMNQVWNTKESALQSLTTLLLAFPHPLIGIRLTLSVPYIVVVVLLSCKSQNSTTKRFRRFGLLKFVHPLEILPWIPYSYRAPLTYLVVVMLEGHLQI